MANTRFTVPCPSCEGEVEVRSSASIGSKIECAKCKYRFTCPPPPSKDDDEGDNAAETPTPVMTKKPKKGAGNSTVMIGSILGVLAVAVLVGGAVFLFGDGEEPKPAPKPFVQIPPQPVPMPEPEPEPEPEPMPKDPTPKDPTPKDPTPKDPTPKDPLSKDPVPKDPVPKDPMPKDPTPKDPLGDPLGQGPKNNGGPRVPVRPKRNGPLPDPTNLLPNEAAAVWRINVPEIAKTPFYAALFDTSVRELFQNSMSFPPDDVLLYIHCVVNPDREPFALIRTKNPVDEQTLFDRSSLVPAKSSPIRGRHYFLIQSNPLIQAVSGAFSTDAILSQMGIQPPPNLRRPSVNKPLALHIYDDQTIIISTEMVLERYLTDLQDSGFPPYRTDLIPPTAPPPMPGTGAPGTGTPMPGTPGATPAGTGSPATGSPMPATGTPATGTPATGTPATGTPGTPMPASGPPPVPGKRKLFTTIPTYRTVDPELKRTLNALEEDTQNPAAMVYAEIVDQRVTAIRNMTQASNQLGLNAVGALDPVRVFGFVLSHFSKEKFGAVLSLEFVSDDDAKRAITQQFMPMLNFAALPVGAALSTAITVRNQLPAPMNPMNPNDPMNPMAAGTPTGAEGSPPIPADGMPPAATGMPPGSFPPGTTPPGTTPPGTNASYVDVFAIDRVVNISATINWNEEKYSTLLLPAIIRTFTQLKGRMAVLSGETDWHMLAAGIPKLTAQKRPFPRGTLERESSQVRLRLPYPPEQRVSFLADLLPFIGRAGLRTQIQDQKFAWYDSENLPAAEAWVPEFLVPSYPQSSWRTTYPKSGNRSLGGTNFVGLAGLGLNAARANPSDPSQAKRVGITGYEWGSTPADITDGLANTIYLIQVPPTQPRPWIAGGGSTLVGVDDNDDQPMRPFVHQSADGQRGTVVLMADGSVRWLKEGMNPAVFKGMVTRAGAENLSDLDKLAPKLKPAKQDNELRGGAAALPGGGAAAVPVFAPAPRPRGSNAP